MAIFLPPLAVSCVACASATARLAAPPVEVLHPVAGCPTGGVLSNAAKGIRGAQHYTVSVTSLLLQVFIAKDACDTTVLLNILLTILGWIPGAAARC